MPKNSLFDDRIIDTLRVKPEEKTSFKSCDLDDEEIEKEFQEFDLPKSKSKTKGKKSSYDEFDDDEFKDLGFTTSDYDDDDDF